MGEAAEQVGYVSGLYLQYVSDRYRRRKRQETHFRQFGSFQKFQGGHLGFLIFFIFTGYVDIVFQQLCRSSFFFRAIFLGVAR